MSENKPAGWHQVLLLVAPFLALILSLFVGRYEITPGEVVKVLFSPFVPVQPGTLAIEKSVILAGRLPRVILAMLVGAGLGVSGAAFQGLFRNPLVSPDILGVTSGSAFGAILAILLGGQSVLIQFFAVPFGIASVFIAYGLSRTHHGDSRLLLVLAGMVISTVFTALISLIKYIADPYDELPTITYWLMGSLASASYADLRLVALPIMGGMVILLLVRWKINILSLGEEEARSLGVNIEQLKWLIIGAVTVVTAAAVSVTGIIGWVGLIIPHIGRMIVGPDHKTLLPASASLGATFLVLIDLIGRTATAAEIPLGILTAISGAPFFVFLLKRTGGYWT